MPQATTGGGIPALRVSRELLDAPGLSVGEDADVEIDRDLATTCRHRRAADSRTPPLSMPTGLDFSLANDPVLDVRHRW